VIGSPLEWLRLTSDRGKLAPISGSIEATDGYPLAAAEREIREETRLTAHTETLQLGLVGPSFRITDYDAGREWKIHPFSWTLSITKNGPNEKPNPVDLIKLDWEHDGFEIVDVGEVLEGKWDAHCVPGIRESLRRVYNGPGGIFSDHSSLSKQLNLGLRSLRSDHRSGARELATRALSHLRSALQIVKDDSINETDIGVSKQTHWDDIQIIGWHLVHSARPSMGAAIGSTVIEALSKIKPFLNADIVPDFGAALNLLSTTIEHRSSGTEHLNQTFTEHISRRLSIYDNTINIVTLSSSGTICAALLYAIKKSSETTSINITILESRPQCEGASLAASLVGVLRKREQSGLPRINIKLTPDFNVANALARDFHRLRNDKIRTYLVLGADRISAQGSVLNKTGTHTAALVARSAPSKPVARNSVETIVLADTDKIAPVMEEQTFTEAQTLDDPDAVEESETNEARMHSYFENVSGDEILGSPETPYGRVSAREVECLREPYLKPFHWDFNMPDDSQFTQAELEEREKRAYEEVKQKSRISLEISCPTFEWTPAALIDTYITEKGVMDRNEIAELSMQKRDLEDQVFAGIYGAPSMPRW
jgi:translation initiation factor 2B subunit (eIF-2B alpha/beta/delta family)